VYYFYRQAIAMSSFYFMLMLTLYAYVGISYVVTRLLRFDNIGTTYFIFMYFIASGVYVILFLIRMNKKLKKQ